MGGADTDGVCLSSQRCHYAALPAAILCMCRSSDPLVHTVLVCESTSRYIWGVHVSQRMLPRMTYLPVVLDECISYFQVH
jgi:hypothetical protein